MLFILEDTQGIIPRKEYIFRTHPRVSMGEVKIISCKIQVNPGENYLFLKCKRTVSWGNSKKSV